MADITPSICRAHMSLHLQWCIMKHSNSSRASCGRQNIHTGGGWDSNPYPANTRCEHYKLSHKWSLVAQAEIVISVFLCAMLLHSVPPANMNLCASPDTQFGESCWATQTQVSSPFLAVLWQQILQHSFVYPASKACPGGAALRQHMSHLGRQSVEMFVCSCCVFLVSGWLFKSVKSMEVWFLSINTCFLFLNQGFPYLALQW